MTVDNTAFVDEALRLLTAVGRARRPDGFGWLDDDLNDDPSHPTETWISCRMTHVAALGSLLGLAGQDELVAHGVAALAGPLRDHEHGGWFAGVGLTEEKRAYDHAFVVLALSSATAAGHADAPALLETALADFEARFWDDTEGLTVDVWNRDWSTLDPYRGINANMHTVEAFLAAGCATGDPTWFDRAGRVCDRVIGWAESNQWRIFEHFDEAWVPLPEFNRDEPAHPFRPYGATVGHGLEWSRLLCHADVAQHGAPGPRVAAAEALYARAVRDGWAADGEPGFVYTTDWSGVPVVRARMHWVLAEAMGAAAVLHDATGNAAYAEGLDRWWQFAKDHLIDLDRGSWRHELDASNAPSNGTWVGKPDVYHAFQACLIPLSPRGIAIGRTVTDPVVREQVARRVRD